MKMHCTSFEFASVQVLKTCKWIVSMLILLTANHVYAQPLQLVADIAPLTGSSDPQYLASLNGKLYFSAFRDATGRELYVYDSLNDEVSLVGDLIAGTKSSEPKELIVVDSKLYFLARTPFTSFGAPGAPDPYALFEYNPSTGSIRLLERFLSYTHHGYQVSGSPRNLTEFNNKLYLFSAYYDNADEIQNVLHVFDPATDMLEIVQYYGDRFPANLTILNGKMYFYSTDAYRQIALSMYDPATQTGSIVLEELNILASTLIAMGDKLYFAGHDGSEDYELFVFNPSTNSLTLAADINPTSSSSPKNFIVFNNKLYFQAKGLQGVELFVYDPATLAASQVADIKPGAGNSNPESLFVFNDMLYFSTESDSLGRELFVYDATSNKVSMVADIAPGAASSSPSSFAIFNDQLFFSALHPAFGRELWKMSEQSIAGFSLINARKDTVIQTINNKAIISLDKLNLYDFNIRAEVGSGFSKVAFQLTGPVSNTAEDTDSAFLVFGQGGHQAMVGSYTLTATPYYQVPDVGEIRGQSLTTTFIFSSVLHVKNVRLVSAADGAEIGKINYNTVIDKATYPVTGINILADVTWPQYNSLYFELTGPVSASTLQNEAPFSLFGDTNGALHRGRLEEGNYTLTVTPYLGKNKTGFAGKPYVVPFKVVDQLKISNLRLIDAHTGVPLTQINNGSVLDPEPLPTEDLNIIADVPNPGTNSVLFELTGPVSIKKLQNTAPYSVFGDNNGTFFSQQLPKGNYTLTATTYRLANQKGKEGEPVIIHFTKNFDAVTSCGTVNAGEDIETCGYPEGGELHLQATVTDSLESITWSTNGVGGFDDMHSLTPTYYYNQSDVNIANIEIYATIQREGCDSETDTVNVYFQAAPALEFPQPFVQQFGMDAVPATVNLYGYASSGTWSSTGSGTFSEPGATYSSYYPSTEDAINGCVELIFTTNDPDGDCGPATGSMTACFNPPCPEVSIGEDITICGYLSGGAISFQASVSGNAEGISWGSSGVGSFDDPNSYSPTYYYDASDVNNAQIEIYASVSNSSGCSASDGLTVYFQAAPAVEFPTPNVYGCAGSPVYANVYLYGYASSGVWSTSGTGTFEDPTATYTAYTPGPEDIGCVTFTFTTNDPDGDCPAVSGTMEACFEDCSGTQRTNSSLNEQEISLYPNPSSHQLELKTKLKIEKSATYITDVTGAKVDFTWGEEAILISHLLPGAYILHTSSQTGEHYVIHFVKL